MTRLNRNKEIVRAWTRGWNEQGVKAVDELFHEDFHDAQLAARAGRGVTLDVLKASLEAYVGVIGHVHFQEQDVVAEGDKVMIRWVMRGRHVGEFLGLPPTHRTFEVDGVNIFRIKDDKIVERWSFFDLQSLIGQLGGKIVPAE